MRLLQIRRAVVCVAATVLLSPHVMSQDKSAAQKSPIGYFLGLDIGGSLLQQGFQSGDFDPEVFALGLSHALAEKDSLLTQEELDEAAGKLRAMMVNRKQEQAAMNKEKGEVWLAANAKKEGVRKLPSGVQMKTLTAGSGASPSLSDQVKVHYTGTLTDGTVFDSSVQRGQPATFVLGQVIKGWQLALQEMKVGEKAMVYIPSDLAYGPNGSPPVIGANEVLVFEVELLEIP